MKTNSVRYLVLERHIVATTELALDAKAAGRRAASEPLPWHAAIADARQACADRPGRAFELHRFRRRGEPRTSIRSPEALERAELARLEGVAVEPVRAPVMRDDVLEDGDGLPWPLDADGWPVEPA